MRIFELRPYLLAGAQKTGGRRPPPRATSVGFQLPHQSTVKLDFTLNPDFAQVESDQMIVNLTGFPSPFRKSAIFPGGQNFFDFGLGNARPFYSAGSAYPMAARFRSREGPAFWEKWDCPRSAS